MIAMILLLGATALAADTTFPFEVSSTTLDNGLTVHVVPMGTPDVAAVYTWFAVGSRDEIDEGRTGFAHFFEHLAFYGTETLPGDERERAILKLGAEENAWTWTDETVYHATLPAKNVPRYLEMEADRFANLKLTPDDVQKEAGAVYGEYRKNAASPGNALSTKVWGAAFTTHTYGHDTIGYEADIQAMPDAFEYSQTFFDRFYRPGNATILVTGDVDPTEVFALVDQHWSGWEAATEPRPEIPEEPEQTELREVEIAWPSPTAPRLELAWKIPASDPTNPEVAVLQVIADWLFSSVGPLEEELVRKEGIAYQINGWRTDLVDPGVFTLSVVCKDPEHLGRAEEIVREQIAKLGEVDPEQLARTKSASRYGWLSSMENPNAVANSLGWSLRRDSDPKAIDTWWANYDAVTPEEIAEVAAKTFVDERLTKGTLVHVPTETEEVAE